ncbi:hypothetical protein HYR99_33940 [Candidatus Poribacteria bacterium]|nr:hypothetical protein [Candidatus Poribacteria bacterium]
MFPATPCDRQTLSPFSDGANRNPQGRSGPPRKARRDFREADGRSESASSVHARGVEGIRFKKELPNR